METDRGTMNISFLGNRDEIPELTQISHLISIHSCNALCLAQPCLALSRFHEMTITEPLFYWGFNG